MTITRPSRCKTLATFLVGLLLTFSPTVIFILFAVLVVGQVFNILNVLGYHHHTLLQYVYAISLYFLIFPDDYCRYFKEVVAEVRWTVQIEP